MKMTLKMKKKSHKYNINIPWLRYGHKYTNKKHMPQYNDNFMY